MKSRRQFILQTSTLALGSILTPSFLSAKNKNYAKNVGLQLYTFRKDIIADAAGTLKKIAALGYKQIESAGSEKGAFYGLKPKEMKNICNDLGMTLRSGHIHIDDRWKQTLENAIEAGQEYMICSSMPKNLQTVDNYKSAAESFNKLGEEASKAKIKFGYHNHDAEFETEKGQVLYDVLMDNTDVNLVHMEMDLGWVIAAGKNPIDYFKKYPGRFPLWHLKDMDIVDKHKHSVEFGKGALDFKKMFANAKLSGMKYYFVEQEEYANNPWDSMKENMDYLKKFKA